MKIICFVLKSVQQNIIYLKGIFILQVLFLVFIGCGNNEDANNNISSDALKTESNEVKIIVSVNNGAHEDDKLRLAEQIFMNKLWQEKYANSEIRFDDWQYSNDTFMVKIKGGTATDVIGLHATEGTMVIEKGYALDLTDYIQQWDKFPLINKEVFEPFSRDGRIYGIPGAAFGGGGYVMTLFYNKDMFIKNNIVDSQGEPKPPQTWEDFVEAAKKLTDKNKGIAGFGILGDTHGSGWHFLNWVWQAGGDFEKKIDGKWTAVFDSQEAINALQFIKDLRWRHDVLQSNLLCNNDDLFELFTSERIAMALFTPEYLKYLVEKFNFPLEKIGICLLPAGPGGRANQMGGGYGIINPNIDSKKIEMAINLLLFDYDPYVMEERAKFQREEGEKILGHPPMIGWGTLPLFKSEYQSKIDTILDKYRTIPSQKELMAEALKYIHPEPPFYSQQLYGEALGPSIQAVLTNKNSDPAKLLKDANTMFQKRFLDKIQ